MKTKRRTPKSADQLSLEAQFIFDRVAAEWSVHDAAGLVLLRSACEAFDRLQEAKGILRREGVVVKDRFGQQRLHPATVIEREARAGMLASFKAMGLDFASLDLPDDAA